MRIGLTLLFISLLIFTSNSCGQNNYTFSEVETIINNAIEDYAFPGAVVLVSKDGNVVFNKAFGNFTYDKNSKPVTTETIYDLASLTKVIAATTAAMICVDRNLFSLDDKVSKFIPEFAANNKKNISIKNLLLHNSGLPSWKKFWGVYDKPEEILNDIYSTKLDYETGIKTAYSDLGIIVLGKVIEKVSGKTLDLFCKEEIFIPIGMNDSYFNPPDSLKYKIAPTEIDNYWRKKLIKGEVHDETAFLLKGIAGHAGLFSTAEDLHKLLFIYLNKGKFEDKQFIQGFTIEYFTKQQEKSTRALGWDIKSHKGSSAGNLFSNASFGHTGFTGTSVWIDPVKKIIVILLTNRVHPSRENKKILKIRPELHDAVIKAFQKSN